MKSKEFWVNQLGESWTSKLKPLLKTDYMEKLVDKLAFDYIWNPMYPKTKEDVFKAFKSCSWDSLRIVVIGTAPSIPTGEGGLAFSNIDSYQNLSALQIRNCVEKHCKQVDLEFDFTFEHWAKQGILMLNRSLACYNDDTKSHKDDWKQFFGSILYLIEKEKPGTIFLLWGKESKKYAEILSINHHVFIWEHPMKAHSEYREWECPNFKQVDILIEHIYGKKGKIQWLYNQQEGLK